jgi:hypothetical protein
MARKDYTNEYIVIGNTGGEGGHNIMGKNPNYRKPGSAKDKAYKEGKWNAASSAVSTGKRQHWERQDYQSYSYYVGKKAKSSTNFKAKDKKGRAMYETDVKRLSNRKDVFAKHMQGALGKAWEGNEWMKKAIDKMWEKDQYGVRGIYSKKHYTGKSRSGVAEGEGGPEIMNKAYRGYGEIHKKDRNRLAHTMTTLAANVKGEEKRLKDTKERKKTTTMMTGGHAGVLGKATSRRETLLGSEDKRRGRGGRAHGTKRRPLGG